MRTYVLAALAALWAGPGIAESCTVVTLSPDTGTGEVSGYVLTNEPLCYFNDRLHQSGRATLIADNACMVPGGGGNCTREIRFNTGDRGFRFIVHQDQLRAGHEFFTLRLTAH